jgi:hypothetical protein
MRLASHTLPARCSGAGDLFRVETVDWTGGQIHDNDDASDIRDVNLLEVHYLSGPIAVNDAAGAPAQPGDLLCVEICQLGPLPGDEWGFTGAQRRTAAALSVSAVLTQAALRALRFRHLRPRQRRRLPDGPLPLRHQSHLGLRRCAAAVCVHRTSHASTVLTLQLHPLQASTRRRATSRACASRGSSTRG